VKNIYGFLLFASLTAYLLVSGQIDFAMLTSLLAALCLFIVKVRFFDNMAGYVVFFAAVFALSCWNVQYSVLLGIPVFDFAYAKKYIGCAAAFADILPVVRSSPGFTVYAVTAFVLCGLFGYMLGVGDSNSKKHITALDNERRLRYELEKAQNELLASRAEVEKLTEDKERNRIAHELHDNIGHGIAGVIFQLEGAARIFSKDSGKALEIIKLCSQKLSETLDTMRNTVYNIKPENGSGLDAVKQLIDDFRFCRVEFSHTGDFSKISATNLRIIIADIKEALTNVSKYSSATCVNIKINVGSKYIRLSIQDNGAGCPNIQEGLGISGMRERAATVGGTFSADGKHNFCIVCTLPVSSESDKD
jgi:signal transduction histidine kinase